jgi:hypothetical protein
VTTPIRRIKLTDEQIPLAVERLNHLLKLLSEGKTLHVEGEPYPIAMGFDGTVGWKWSEDKITGSFEVVELLEMAYRTWPILDRETD